MHCQTARLWQLFVIRERIVQSLVTIGLSLFVAASGIAVAHAIHVVEKVPFDRLTRDPAGITHTPAYFGLLSNLGVVAWAASAAISLFVATCAPALEGQRKERHYLFACGLLSVLLGFDDLFLGHERILGRGLHVPDTLTFLAYAVIGASILLGFRKEVLRTDLPILGLAGLAFGLSVYFDMFARQARGQFLLEDGSKFVGITCWLSYVVRTAADTLARQRPQTPPHE